MGLGDDGIAGGDSCGKIAAADAIEGEWEVVGAEDDDRAYRSEVGADVQLEIEGCALPGFFSCCCCGLRRSESSKVK